MAFSYTLIKNLSPYIKVYLIIMGFEGKWALFEKTIPAKYVVGGYKFYYKFR